MSIDNRRVSAINELVVGWMIPVMKRTDPFTGDVLNGLGPSDFRRVEQGYGCPRCLAMFRTYLVKCPACDYQRDVMADVAEAPQHWVDHLEERNSVEGKPVSTDDFLAEIARSRDVDQVKL